MTPRLLLMTLAFALVASVTFAAAEGEEAAAAEKEMVVDPSTGKMVTAPEYGGTIRAIMNFKPEGIDPYFRYTAGNLIGLVNEKLGVGDWAVDRSVVGYTTLFLPDEALVGQLAESWENPDPLTSIFKIRDGVFWHDKAPVNGRQLTAHDVAYSWQRLLFGVDGGESSPDCRPGGFDICNIKWESVTATDDSTVEFKLQEPSVTAFSRMLVAEHGYIVAREVVDEFGDIQDWRNVTGTGPYQLTDVVEGSSWTYTKIDDYWGFDPKFPDNRLPYADTIEFLVVNDPTAITSLMRSGQADWIGFGLNSHLTSVDSAVNLQKTNPNLVLHPYAYRSETAIGFNLQKEPWSDIRVRQALSLAIDHESIAENYQQGWGDASPQGATGANVIGYAVPYEEWPEETQQYYRYDPEEAERLLDEAGYPRGDDGIRFSTIYSHYEFFDLGYYQIAMDYLRQIGIDVEIEEITRAQNSEWGMNHGYPGLRTDVWAAEYPSGLAPINSYWSQAGWNPNNNSDAVFDELYENALAATTVEEQKEWARKANLRIADQLWMIRGPIAPLFGATQPWIKGYNGEGDIGGMQRSTVLMYLWVDQDLKRELGF
ncbi:MAG: ABC transporter substrate-binding protein [Spirochaetaceae bacterium]|nr:ABC transporter substrate-binding protein [Spirochaetaceae bacterium]